MRFGKRHLSQLRRQLAEVRADADESAATRERARAAIADLIAREGLQAVAAKLDINVSNLSKMARRRRPICEAVAERVSKLERYVP